MRTSRRSPRLRPADDRLSRRAGPDPGPAPRFRRTRPTGRDAETTAQLATARLQITALRSTYQQKLADQKAAEETLTYQQREFDRQRQLAATGVASRQMFDQTQMALDVARQKLVATQHDLGNIL